MSTTEDFFRAKLWVAELEAVEDAAQVLLDNGEPASVLCEYWQALRNTLDALDMAREMASE